MRKRYTLALGTQVREEDFGLLFYTMKGPRLYFFSSGNFLTTDFFCSGLSLEGWLKKKSFGRKLSSSRLQALEAALEQLKEKEVILEY